MSDLKILDMSAGNRAMWFDKNNPMVTFLDIRESVNPDIVCDTKSMPPNVGDGYDLIVFDPPHANFSASSDMSKAYGHFTASEIYDTIKKSAKEAHRVSKPCGLMAFKWSDRDKNLKDILGLMAEFWEPLFGQIVAQRQRRKTSSKISNTYWVMLQRLDAYEKDRK